VSSGQFRVEPARLRGASRRVAGWGDRVEDHGTTTGGAVPRALDDAERSLEGAGLADALAAAAVAITRAGDGFASSLRVLGDALDRTADRCEAADESAARALREGRAGPGQRDDRTDTSR